MTKSKLKDVIQIYKSYFKMAGSVIPQQFPTDKLTTIYYKYDDLINHCYYMVLQMEKFVDEDEQKAHRWLGFIQGCLWSLGETTIDSLNNINVYIEKDY